MAIAFHQNQTFIRGINKHKQKHIQENKKHRNKGRYPEEKNQGNKAKLSLQTIGWLRANKSKVCNELTVLQVTHAPFVAINLCVS